MNPSKEHMDIVATFLNPAYISKIQVREIKKYNESLKKVFAGSEETLELSDGDYKSTLIQKDGYIDTEALKEHGAENHGEWFFEKIPAGWSEDGSGRIYNIQYRCLVFSLSQPEHDAVKVFGTMDEVKKFFSVDKFMEFSKEP